MKLLFLLFFVTVTFWPADAANVLCVVPMAAYSHFTLMFRIAKELADKGHQVTVINPYPQKTPIKNYKDVVVEASVEFVDEIRLKLLSRSNFSSFQSISFLFDMGLGVTELTFQDKDVQELLRSNETFDVVILEHFVDEALAGFAYRFKAPLIILSPMATSSMNNYLFANPAPASYVPNLMAGLTKHMNFWQRLKNFLSLQLADLFRELYYLPKQRALFNKYITSDIQLDDVLYNTSLMLTNSHVSIHDAVPLVPSIIEIGGYHVSPPKPLPDDLKIFLDNGKHGVILFSLGSNLKSKDLKPEVQKSILQAFSKIKQQVLWKFEAELADLPKNVKIMKWLPQQDILAHPNIKAFISHGGLLSTIEAVYHGVPIIGIPVYGDQKSNIGSAVANGYAVSVPLEEISEENLSWALNEILNNPKYRENIQRRSKLMNDQPLKPLDAAVYWVEHVIRHRGAPHLRSAGLDLKWYEREMVDIVSFLALVILGGFFACYLIVRKVLRLLCSNKTKKNKKVKKN